MSIKKLNIRSMSIKTDIFRQIVNFAGKYYILKKKQNFAAKYHILKKAVRLRLGFNVSKQNSGLSVTGPTA